MFSETELRIIQAALRGKEAEVKILQTIIEELEKEVKHLQRELNRAGEK